MSEKVLRAIIQLLVASAQIDGVTQEEKQIIQKFLEENFDEEVAREYAKLFDKYATQTLNPEKICQQLNAELTKNQKIIILAYLLELSIADGNASERELKFSKTIATYFNLENAEYELLRHFIIEDFCESNIHGNIVWIDAIENTEREYKHIFRGNLDGAISILRIPSAEMYLLKYVGKTDVFLNTLPIKVHHVYPFPVGSSIRAENMKPVYYSDVVGLFLNETTEIKISFEAQNIWYQFANGRIGLRDISISEGAGQLIGLMGASGSGKSTLLNVLNGTLKPTQGKVLINGIDIHQDRQATAGLIGYVPQDDLLIEELTVYQNLYYAAKLSISDATEQELDELVQKTLKSLGISEIQDLKVGNPLQKTISGGQRKRVNVALELLREPYILFVDEPTSGLSSRDSENIMVLFKELALRGKLVFIVIHQPSSDIFKMFDKLLILDVGGYPIYYGNPLEAVTYFKRIAGFVDKDKSICGECGNINPEQIFNIVETKVVNEYGTPTDKRKVSPQKWNEYYKQLTQFQKVTPQTQKPTVHFKVASFFKQMQVYLTRDVLAKLSNTQYMVINLLEAPLLALILAFVVRFYQVSDNTYIFAKNNNLPAYIFMAVIVALFVGLSVSAEEIIKDAKIRKRERFLHLSRMSYLISKVILMFSFSAIQMLSFVLIGNWILGIEGMNMLYWLVLFSTACFANMLGLNVSATFNSVVTIYILIPLLLIPQLLLGGIVVRFNEINPVLGSDRKVPLLAEFMASRWAFEALVVGQFKLNRFEQDFYPYDQKIAQAEYHKVLYIPELETKLDNAFNFQAIDSLQQEAKENLAVLKNELQKQNQLTGLIWENPEKLDLNNLKDKYQALKEHLQKLKKFYVLSYNEYSEQKDKIIASLTKTETQRRQFLTLKNTYHNEAIEKLVKAIDTPERIITTEENRLVQKIYPIFQLPEPSHSLDFRTHFFAPQKYFANRFWETIYFNVCVIWLMSGVLFVTLYFNVFRKMIEFAGVFISRMQKNKFK
ncbi:MAG: ATP-binding cassette domain-containing protein [Raineya sp.]|nr:ATP-binding cassette domain-containing protein [Raineya sp.]